MSLTVVLVNWRNEQQTLRCAKAIGSWHRLIPDLIVVDNESNDVTRGALRAGLKPDQLICSPANLGYGGGNNLGISRALGGSHKFILLMNSDVEISEAVVSRLLERLKANPDISILGPIIQEGQNSTTQCLIGGKDIASNALSRIARDLDDLESIPGYPLHDVEYVAGTIFLARRDLFQEIGLLDERFFFSGEIADFCKRARNRDHRACVDLTVEAYHDTSQTPGQLRDTLYTYYSLRNRFLYVKKHHPTEQLQYFAFWVIRGALEVTRSLGRTQLAKARALLLALLHGCSNTFGNQNARFDQVKGSKVPWGP